MDKLQTLFQEAIDHFDRTLEEIRIEISRVTQENIELEWLVHHDELTGMPNRRRFKALAPAVLNNGDPVAVVMLDLNGFKEVNDRYGHHAGDEVLVEVGKRLTVAFAPSLVARLGGDEFVAILSGDQHDIEAAVVRTAQEIAQPIVLPQATVSVTGCFGIAVANGTTTLSELMTHSDLAMYDAKVNRATYSVFHDDDGYVRVTAKLGEG